MLRLYRRTLSRRERNICYVNACLQLLHAIPVFRRFFLDHQPDPREREKSILCDELHRIFQCAETGEPTSAAKLRDIVGAWRGRDLGYICGGGQQDASMFLALLLDLVEEELTKAGQGHRSLKSRYEGSYQYQYWFLNSSGGQCMTCGDWQAPNEQPFIVLNVEASSSINLQNMVNSSFEPEKLIKRCGNAGCQASIPVVGNEKPAMSQKTITNLPAAQ